MKDKEKVCVRLRTRKRATGGIFSPGLALEIYLQVKKNRSNTPAPQILDTY